MRLKRKKIKFKIIIFHILSFFLCMSVGGCFWEKEKDPWWYSDANLPKYSTQYTEEEHIQRIREEIVKNYNENESNIAEYHIEIVYSFYDHQPEYFLITIEYNKEDFFKGIYYKDGKNIEYVTKYEHLVGKIVDDGYTHGGTYEEFIVGRSPWDFCGYREDKKYYGEGIFAVEKGESRIMQFFNRSKVFDKQNLEFLDSSMVTNMVLEQKFLLKSEEREIKESTFQETSKRYVLYKKEF